MHPPEEGFIIYHFWSTREHTYLIFFLDQKKKIISLSVLTNHVPFCSAVSALQMGHSQLIAPAHPWVLTERLAHSRRLKISVNEPMRGGVIL